MNPRRKGHNFERLLAKRFKEVLGHNVKSTRSSSRMLDNCGIDLVNTDMLIQCKAGYENRRPRYEEVYQYIKANLATHFSPEHSIHNYPILLIHNIDVGSGKKRSAEYTTVTMTLDDYLNIRVGNINPVLQIL